MGRKPKKKDIAEYLWHSEPTKINATNDNWRIRYGYLDSEGKEHQTTETVNNERAKNQFVSYLLLREKEHKAAKGTTVASKVDKTEIETVEQLLYAYAEHTKYLHTIGDRYGWDEGTYRANIGKIRNYIVPVFGSFPIWKITRVDMRQGFKDMLRLPQANGNHKANGARVSQRTVYDCKKIISRAFKYATDDLELITENPMLGVTVKQPKSSRREVWTEEQFNFAYDNCSDPQLKLLISLMVALSSRIGECLALTWSDVYDNEDKHEPSYIRNYKELTYRTENFIKETNGRGILKVFDQVRSTRPDAKRRAVFHVTKTEKEIEAKTDRIYIAPEVIFMLRDYRLVQNQHMGILDGIVEWIAEQIMYGLDMINTSVLGALGCDMDTFLRYFPAAETMYSLLVALAIGLILLGWVWNLFKNYGLGLGVDAEDPVKLTAKAILFIVLAYYADEIVNIALTIGGTPYAWILSSELPSLDFASFNSVLLTIIGVCANGGVALIVLILTLILAWNYIKLLFEAAERYVLLGVLVYTAPVAFAMGASQSTANIFKSWCRMFGGQIFLLLMNAWCLRLFITMVGTFISNPLSM